MKGLFIPEITAEMFRNGCLESIEALMAEGKIYDIDYQQPCEDAISRKAVLDKLNKLIEVERLQGTDEMGYGRERVSAYESMIFEIESKYLYPSVNPQQPCEDCISRQAVNDLVDELARAISDERCCISRGRSTATIVRDIRHLPPITPKEKTGKWIRWYETIEQEHCTIHDPHCKCSECNQEYDPYIASLFNYCPNCGAKMIEPHESEDKE